MTTHVTLSDIRRHGPCENGWKKLLKRRRETEADDKPVHLLKILKRNSLNDALWCLRALPEHMNNRIRLLACDFAEHVMCYVPEGETRPQAAIDTARRFARGEATQAELATARSAAWSAAWSASDTAATHAATAAAHCADAIACEAVMDVARSAMWSAVWADAWDTERESQTETFKRHVALWEGEA